MKLSKSLALVAILVLSACMSYGGYRDTSKPFSHVGEFEAQKYLGKWYEIARFPLIFENGCFASTANYALISEEEIQVVNTCNQQSVDGPLATSKGKARIEAPGVLTVTFFGGYPDEPNYYVMALKGDYEIAVIGEPKGNSGWILARDAQISDEDYAWATSVLADAGYDLAKLYKTPQMAAE